MLFAFFEWVDSTRLAWLMRDTTWGFAIVSVFHLFGIILLLGGVAFMSMRLFGLFMTDRPVSDVADGLARWTLLGLILTLITGAGLFSGETMRLYDSGPFWTQMTFLFFALIFHFSLYRKVTRWDQAPPLLRGITGFLAVTLWLGVGIAARAIGFFSY
jgi:hypothetical protein